MASGIYEIVNLVNGKRYVGSAVDIAQRWREHRKGLRAGRHHSRHLQSAWLKYGTDAFEFRIVAECDPLLLIAKEQAEFDRLRPDYNICPTAGSTLGRPHSAETRNKIGASKRGLKMPPRDENHRAKLSAAHKGRKKAPAHMAALQDGRRARLHTDEDRARVSESLKVAFREGRHRRDRPPEYRAKIAEALTGRKLTEQHRANVAASMRGKKRGPYKLDPAKAEARRQAGKALAAEINERRRGYRA